MSSSERALSPTEATDLDPDRRIVTLLGTLIGFDTTSAKSNLAMIDWLETYLAGLGARTERFASDDGRKAGLWATFGPIDRPGIVLSGHTDVVPTAGQSWSGDPYALRQAGQRLTGRGACDMKGFLAVVLALLPELDKSRLAKPLHLSFSYDEEVGIVGVRQMLRRVMARIPRPFGCIVGEATGMNIVIGHKGKRAETVTVRGKAIHSALAPQGVNAIGHAARLITFINGLQAFVRDRCEPDAAFEVPYPTINVGPIRGGQSVATVADFCTFDYEIRGQAGTRFDEIITTVHDHARHHLLPEMHRVSPDCGIDFAFHTDYPAFEIEPDHTLVRLAATLLPDADIGKMSGGTEAGLFAQIADVPTVIIGPGFIEQAHQADEYVELDQLMRCRGFLQGLLQQTVLAQADGATGTALA